MRPWLAVAAVVGFSLLTLTGAAPPAGTSGSSPAAATAGGRWPGSGPPTLSTPGGASVGGTPPADAGRPGSGASPAEAGPLAPPVAGAQPDPYIQSFAQQPGVPRQTPSPTGKHPVPSNVDGCDHNYGSPGQCVPWRFPPGTLDRCLWLASHGFGPLPVIGADRLALDPDRDGIACDPGDR